MELAVLLTFDELRDLYGMTNIRPDQRRQIEFLLETAEEEVLAYSEVNLEGEFEEVFAGQNLYILSRRPVIRVISCTQSGAAIPYSFSNNTNTIKVNSDKEITVRYQCGFDKIPRILKQCIAVTVQYWLKFLNSNIVGVTSRTADGGSESIEQYELPLVVKSSLARFRRTIY